MPILTRAELETRLGAEAVEQLTDLENLGMANAARVQAALDDADAEVMGYVRAATAAPLPDPAPETLKRLVAIVAHYNLWRRGPGVTEASMVYVAYKDALAQLRDIAAGRIALFQDAASAAVPAGAAAWAPPRLLTDAVLARMLP